MGNTTTDKKTFQVIDYLKCRTELNSLGISDAEIQKALNELNITKNDLTDKQGFQNIPNYLKVFEVTKERHQFKQKQYNGAWEKEVDVIGVEVMIPSQYQGLKHGKIIETILKNRFSWFSSFTKDKNYKEKIIDIDYCNRLDLDKLTDEQKNLSINELLDLSKKEVIKKESAWSLYEMHTSENYELYLSTEFGSLYVPLKAILSKDFSLIEKRLKTYAESYHDPKKLSCFALNHRGRTIEQYKKDKEADYLKMIEPLKSKEAKELKKYLKS